MARGELNFIGLINRKGREDISFPLGVKVGEKRGGDEMNCDEGEGGEAKKSKTGQNTEDKNGVGLSEQPCEHK